MIIDAQVIDETTGEVLPPDYLPVPAPDTSPVYRPSFLLSVDDAVEQADQMREFLTRVLREGVDYGHIPGVKKPSLFKPGAEWLLRVQGLGNKIERTETFLGNDGLPTGFMYRCTIVRTLADGVEQVVSEHEAYAGRDEPKWKTAPIHTIAAMAQKRALVGAALKTGASGILTSDVEDYDQAPRQPVRDDSARYGSRQEAPRRPPTVPDVAPQEDEPRPEKAGGFISEPQIKMVYRCYGALGIDDGDEQKQLAGRIIGHPVESHKNLTKRDARTLIDRLLAAEKGEASLVEDEQGWDVVMP